MKSLKGVNLLATSMASFLPAAINYLACLVEEAPTVVNLADASPRFPLNHRVALTDDVWCCIVLLHGDCT
jgi:hypothetical protein